MDSIKVECEVIAIIMPSIVIPKNAIILNGMQS